MAFDLCGLCQPSEEEGNYFCGLNVMPTIPSNNDILIFRRVLRKLYTTFQ
jgi:hypothetical protein